MADIILHHYPVSHYSEKIRRILAYKRVSWRSVEQPIMMPKPSLVPLTGGYRRCPVMQVGADIYCDSACIARAIERLHPAPACIPQAQAGLITLLEDWADKRFGMLATIPSFVELIPVLPPDVMDDRAKMAPGLTKEAFIAGAPHAIRQVSVAMQQLNAMLTHQQFLLGDNFTLADAACYFGLWLMRNAPALFDQAMAPYPLLRAWFARMEAFGPGTSTAMTTDEALAIARAAQPTDLDGGGDLSSLGTAPAIACGNKVSVIADDYGQEVITGKLARVTDEEFALLRDDPDLGAIAVHFPLLGYRISAA